MQSWYDVPCSSSALQSDDVVSRTDLGKLVHARGASAGEGRAHRVINPTVRQRYMYASVQQMQHCGKIEHPSVVSLIVPSHPTAHSLPIAHMIPLNRQHQQYLRPEF